MQTKAYFASSVPAAFEVARQELGENALLVSSKPSPPQARQFGRLEVTFAFDPQDAPPPSIRRPSASALTPAGPSGSEMDEIRQQLSALRVAVGRDGQFPGAPAAYTATEDRSISAVPTAETVTLERLLEAGFGRETAVGIAAGAARWPGNPDTAVVQELTSRIPIAPFVEMKPDEHRTLAFIGPPGRGKTISLVKIAVRFGLARHIPVRIYCAGAHCIGAQDQMTRFAAILGTPYQACESLASLNLALNGEGWKGLVLIDTPGISPADRDELGEFRSFFAARPEIEKHLVLRADAGFADIVHMMSRFSGLTPSRLLFTGLDEAVSVVPAIEALIRGGIPATFAGTGQQIPEDLEEVKADRLSRAVWAGMGQFAAATNGKLARTASA
jgi:flagellar biosynthesis GTPase FlhF